MPEKNGAQRTYPYTSILHRLETDKKAVKILRTEFVALNVHTSQQQSVFTRGQQLMKFIETKERVFLREKKGLTPRCFVWNTTMAAVLQFWYSNMADAMSHNCFWDRYRGRAGQLLANFFPVPSNSPRSLCGPVFFWFLKWRMWKRSVSCCDMIARA